MAPPNNGNPGGGKPGGGGGGSGGAITIDGDNDNNVLAGTPEDELIRGKKGDDVLFGAGGDDTVEGGMGNDTLISSADSDVLDGGFGLDTVEYRAATTTSQTEIELGIYYSVFGYDISTGAENTTIADIKSSDGDTGTDSLIDVEYAVFSDDDADGDGTSGLITVFLDGTNNAALAVKDVLVGFDENTIATITAAQLLANDLEFDGEGIAIRSVDTSLSSGLLSTTQNPDGTIATIDYDPTSAFDYLSAGEVAYDNFDYTVIDPLGEGTTARVSLEVTGRNDAPVLAAIAQTVIPETTDTSAIAANIGVSFTDVDLTDTGHTATVTSTGTSGTTSGLALDAAALAALVTPGVVTKASGFSAGDVTLAFSAASTVFDYLADGEQVTLNYSVLIDDQDGGQTAQAFDVTVTGTNDDPLVTNEVVSIDEDQKSTSYSLLANDSDPENQALTIASFASAVAPGETYTNLSAAGNEVSFSVDELGNATLSLSNDFDTLSAGQSDWGAFNYIVEDTQGGQTTGNFYFSATGVNDDPTLSAGLLAAAEDGVAVDLDLSTLGDDVDSDDDGTTLTYAVTGPPSEGSASITGTTLSFDPGADFQDLAFGETRDVAIEVTATDTHGATAANTVTVTVTGVNDDPMLDSAVISGSPVPGLVLNGWRSSNGAAISDFSDGDGNGTTETASLSSTLSSFGTEYGLATGDIDGDGNPDAITATGNGIFTFTNIGDTDGDGDDEFTSIRVMDFLAFDAELVDLNGDGLLDIVAGNGTVFYELINQGDLNGNGLSDDFQFRALDRTFTGSANAIVVADLDGDGRQDVIQAGGSAEPTVLSYNLGDTDGDGLIDYTHIGIADGFEGGALGADVGDIDGDGDVDFALARSDGTQVLYINDGDTSGDGLPDFISVALNTGAHSREVEFADIDGDGDLDLINSNIDGSASLSLNQGDTDGDGLTDFTIHSIAGLSTGNTVDLAVGDIDGDGDLDILLPDLLKQTTLMTNMGDTDGDGVPDFSVEFLVGSSGSHDAEFFTIEPLREDGTAVDLDLSALGDDIDSEDDGSTLTYAVTGDPSEGSASITGTTLTFDPVADFQDLGDGETRDVVIQVTTTDAHGATAVNDVTVTVTGQNDDPIAAFDPMGQLNEDVKVNNFNVLANDSDPENQSLTVVGPIGPITTKSLLGNDVTFDVDVNGDATVTFSDEMDRLSAGQIDRGNYDYIVQDTQGGTSVGTLTFSVFGVNDDPTLAAGLMEAAEDGPTVDLDLSALGDDIDSEDDGSTLTYAVTGDPSEGSASITGTTLSFDPVADFQDLGDGETRDVVIQVTTTDAHGATAVNDVTVTVTGTNDAPVAANYIKATDEDTVLTGNIFDDIGAGADFDVDGDGFTVHQVNGSSFTFGVPTPLTDGGILTLSQNGDFTFDPNGDFDWVPNGASTGLGFNYTIIDDHGAVSNTARANIGIVGLNDDPTLSAGLLAAAEDGVAVDLDLSTLGDDVDSDDDGTTLTYAVTGPPSEGSASITGTTLSFDPGADFQDLAFGETRDVVVEVTATDAHGAIAVNSMTVTVTGVNDDPTLGAGLMAAVEDGSSVDLDLATLGDDVDSDDDGTTLTYAVTGPPSEGSASITGTTLTFDPVADFQDLGDGETRDVVIQVTTTDAHGATAVNDVTVTVTGQIGPVRALALSGWTSGGSAISGFLDGDGNGTTETASLSSTLSSFGTEYGLATGDIDGDGNPDAITATGNGIFTFTNIGDTDGDGDDEFTSIRVMDFLAFDAELVDLNGDGLLDIVAGNGTVFYELINQGDLNGNGLSDDFQFRALDRTFTGSANAIVVADLDGDGRQDVIQAGGSAEPTVLSYNLGDTDGDGLIDYTHIGIADGFEGGALGADAGDIDGDGDVDFALARSDGTQVLYINDGDTSGDGLPDFISVALNTGAHSREVEFADIDGDGDLDLINSNIDGSASLSLNQGDTDGDGLTDFTIHSIAGLSTGNTVDLAVGDIDGDGDLDILLPDLLKQTTLMTNMGDTDGDGVPDFSVEFLVGSSGSHDAEFLFDI